MIIKKKSLRYLLYRSFEEKLKPKEEARLNRILENSLDLKKEKEAVRQMRQMLSDIPEFDFSPDFGERVMRRWREEASREGRARSFDEYLSSFFLKLAYIGTAVALLLVIINFILGDVLSSEEILFASDSVYETLLNLPFF